LTNDHLQSPINPFLTACLAAGGLCFLTLTFVHKRNIRKSTYDGCATKQLPEQYGDN